MENSKELDLEKAEVSGGSGQEPAGPPINPEKQPPKSKFPRGGRLGGGGAVIRPLYAIPPRPITPFVPAPNIEENEGSNIANPAVPLQSMPVLKYGIPPSRK